MFRMKFNKQKTNKTNHSCIGMNCKVGKRILRIVNQMSIKMRTGRYYGKSTMPTLIVTSNEGNNLEMKHKGKFGIQELVFLFTNKYYKNLFFENLMKDDLLRKVMRY